MSNSRQKIPGIVSCAIVVTTEVGSSSVFSLFQAMCQDSRHHTFADTWIALKYISSGIAWITEPLVKIVKKPLSRIWMVPFSKKRDVAFATGNL